MTIKKTPPHLTNTALVTAGLIESEKLYRGIFEQNGIPAVIIDEEATILLSNNRFEELSGYPRGEIEGRKTWTEFVSAQDIEKTLQNISACRKPGGWAPAHYSFGFVDRNGMVRDVSASISHIAGTGLIALSLVDITPRKKIERMLRLNEERYRSLVRTLSTGIFRIYREWPGKFVWASPAFLAMFGYSSLAALLKITAADIFTDSSDQDRLRRELEEGEFARLERIRLKKTDGTILWASVTAEVKRDENGIPAWVDGTVENITRQVLAEEELKITQSRLGELLGAVTTFSLIATGPDGILTVFNTGSERMLGYRAEEVIGRKTPLLFLSPRELAALSGPSGPEGDGQDNGFTAFVSRAQINGCDEREWTFVRQDGTEIPVDLTLTVMRDENGTITGYLGIAQEISERKRLEEAFRHDKLQMSGVIYNIPEPTFAIDRAGKVIAWNRAIEDLSGTKAVDILGKGDFTYAIPFHGRRKPMLANLIFATDAALRKEGFFNIRRDGNSVTAETRLVKEDGRELVIRGIAAPIYNDSGEIAGGIESITDITDVRQKEAELKDSEARFRAILDYIGSAVAIVEEDSTISYINPEFERIIGYVRDEIEGKKKWTEFVVPDDQDRIRKFRKQHRSGSADIPEKCEFRFIRWDGQVRNGYLSITPMPDSGRIVVSLIDITDRVLAEDAIRKANKKLNFFSSVTRHDILNQLTALKGNLELSREFTADKALISSIEKELAAAEAIQSQILFTRDYQDIGIQPPEWQNVRQLILRSCNGILLGAVSVTVRITGVEVYADLLLGSVFSNLIGNAITHGRTVTQVRFSARESFEELVITCEDDGVGIPDSAKEKIFTRQHFVASGLAMFVSREILSITGITIRETGTFGKGARFEIRVPKGAYRFTDED